ncbi:MAG: DNA polymerase/3'-5' exonuclease PolX [Flexistipes sinusarabici]|uniref:DNA polymerase/3'-5' exonuclease PolX n=1 Tax=Flexistipes sinusarabici TaxID=2352 RepID=A0A5D0MG74_FLESI|nr:DNA polymerase/3'-5' exonuclease PolX [Flexistipes sinusarabici]TYB32677.1 MAG: DNA polymerase/3'-5' exonuclease PolX [Flexistipes sinusarabici]
MENASIVEILEEYAKYLEINNEDFFRVRAYNSAARSVLGLDFNIAEILKSGEELPKIKGVGKNIQGHIEEIVNSGTFHELEEIKSNTPQILIVMNKIPGVGAKKAFKIYKELGVNSLGELEYACIENRLAMLEGFGKKTQDKILKNIEYVKLSMQRRLLADAEEAAEKIRSFLDTLHYVEKYEIAGSYRRKLETVKDLDLVIVAKGESNVLDKISKENFFDEIREGGEKKITAALDGLPVDLRCFEKDDFYTALHHFTGSKAHHERLRGIAKSKNFKINEYGIFQGDKKLKVSSEEEIYEILGLHYVPPELREGIFEFREDLDFENLVTEEDIKGIFHIHTNYSDGAMALQDIVDYCRSRNFKYAGISDHSRSAFYAGGLREEELFGQIEKIDAVNAENSDFFVFKGIESDILPDGSLDYSKDVLQKLDFVIASVHSHFNMSMSEMTDRIIKAVNNPCTKILGHPTGRLLLSRDGYQVDMYEVIKECCRNNVIIELNCNPYRLDIDWRYLQTLIKEGGRVILCPDAHSKNGFEHIKYGVFAARKGGLTPAHVLNTLDTDGIAGILKNNC